MQSSLPETDQCAFGTVHHENTNLIVAPHLIIPWEHAFHHIESSSFAATTNYDQSCWATGQDAWADLIGPGMSGLDTSFVMSDLNAGAALDVHTSQPDYDDSKKPSYLLDDIVQCKTSMTAF